MAILASGCRAPLRSRSLPRRHHAPLTIATNGTADESIADSKTELPVAGLLPTKTGVRKVAYLQSTKEADDSTPATDLLSPDAFVVDDEEANDEGVDDAAESQDGVDQKAKRVEPDAMPIATFPLDSAIRNRPSKSAGISLTEIEQQMLAVHPEVGALESSIDAMRGRRVQEGLGPNPKAGVTGSDINEDRQGGRYGVYVGREVVRGGNLQLAQSVVDAEIEVACQQLETLRLRLENRLRQHFYAALVAQEAGRIAEQLTGLARQSLETSGQLYDAGEVTRTAVLQAEIELRKSEIVGRQSEKASRFARQQLAAQIGEPDPGDLPLIGDVNNLAELDDLENSFDNIINAYPEITALQSEVRRAANTLARERAEPIPNITWQTSLAYDTPSDNIVGGFQIGMPIPVINRNQGAICEASHQLVQA